MCDAIFTPEEGYFTGLFSGYNECMSSEVKLNVKKCRGCAGGGEVWGENAHARMFKLCKTCFEKRQGPNETSKLIEKNRLPVDRVPVQMPINSVPVSNRIDR